MRHPLCHAAIIVMVGVLAYQNSLSVPFVFDDIQNIVENQHIKELHNFLTPSVIFGNRPIGLLSFALNYHFYDLNVTSYHAVNLAIHIVNALLVYLLVTAVFTAHFTAEAVSSGRQHSTHFYACATSLLFVSHPVHTGAVTYTVQRFTLLATFFYLVSVLMYLAARSRSRDHKPTVKTRGRLCYAVSLISCLMAMKCKEISFTIPVVIIVAEFIFYTERLKTRIYFLLPFIISLAVIPLSMQLTASSTGDILQHFQQSITLSRTDYLLTQSRVLLTYLRLFVMPVNQNIDYNFPISNSIFQLPVMVSFLFHVTVVSIAVYLATGAKSRIPFVRLISFGLLWFYISLMVESSVIPLDDIVFEHRMYLPSVGLFLVCASVAGVLEKHWVNRDCSVAWCLVGAITCILAIATYQRNSVWQSSMSIWQDAARKSPLKSRPHYNLGYYLAESGDLPSAIREFQTAVQLDPNNSKARNNLAAAYVQTGNIPAAIQEFRGAVIVDRTNANAHFNLGYLLADQGQPMAAINELQKGLQLEPYNQSAINQLKILTNLVHNKGN